jgi:hypothetical protein
MMVPPPSSSSSSSPVVVVVVIAKVSSSPASSSSEAAAAAAKVAAAAAARGARVVAPAAAVLVGVIDADLAAVEVLAGQVGHGALGVGLGVVLDKAEPFVRARVAVEHQLHGLDGPHLGHEVVQVLLRRVVRDVAYKHRPGGVPVDLVRRHIVVAGGNLWVVTFD